MIHILNQDDEIIDYFDINDGTVLEPDLIRNIETLEDTLEFSVATKRSINVQNRNRVIIKDNEGEYREFIIMQYESNLEGFTDVSCVGSHLEDFQTAKPYKPQKLESYTTKEALSFMAADTGWEVAPDNEWNGLKTTSWSSWKDRLSLLKQLQTTYDMRLSFYVELGTNTVKHRYVKLVEVNPMFNGEEIVYGENMIDLKRRVDFTDVATALIAIGPEDDEGNRLIIEEVDNAAQNQLGLPYRYLWQIYEPESDDQNMTEARLRTLARTKLNKIKTASVEYEIKSTQLNVKVGDMIRVKNEDFTPELYVEAEVIEIKYNAYTKLCDYKFGILTEYTRAEVYERFNALLATLRERLNNIKYDTENVINERLEEELAGLERYIEKSPFPPLDPQEGDLWLDTSHDQVAVLKRYENGEWVKSSVTEAHEVNAPTKEEALYTMLQERKNRLNNDFISNYGLFNTLTAHKYYNDLPDGIKNTLYDLFVDQTNKYSAFEADFDYINAEQPTIGLILAAMESALRFEDSSNKFKTGYNTARAALDEYLEILRSQYTDEKHLDALNAVADKFGLDVVDGKLLGDANFIENMEEIKIELQQQLDAAKKAFDELEIGGRNLLIMNNLNLSRHSNTTVDIENGLISGYGSYYFIFENVNMKPDTSYTFSYVSSISNRLSFLIRNKETGDIQYIWNAGILPPDEKVTFKVPENVLSETDNYHIWVYISGAENIEWQVEKIQLEKGTVATDWTPAPEDTDNKITNINQSITNIEGQLKSTVNKDTFDLLNETVTKQGTTIEQTADRLSSKADKSVVDTLSGTVNSHGTQLTQTAAELASKADKSLLDEANNTITQQGTLINQNAQDILLRAKTDDLNTLENRVEQSEAELVVNSKKIAAKVDNVTYQTDKEGIIKRLSSGESERVQLSNQITDRVKITDYEAYKTAQGNKISSMETQISQNGQNILLKASQEALDSVDKTLSSKQAQLEIRAGKIETTVKGLDDNLKLTNTKIEQTAGEIRLDVEQRLSAPSKNLIPHSTLPEENDKWTTWSSTTNISKSNDYMWVYNYNFVENASMAVQSGILHDEVTEGRAYTLSFKATRIENIYDDMRYCYLINVSGGDNFYISTSNITRVYLGKDYRGMDVYLYTATFKPDFSGKARILIGSRTSNTSHARLYIKEPQLEVGDTRTPYSPSPNDLLAAAAQFKITTDAISSTVSKKVGNNEIITRINQTAEKILIDGKRIDLVGDVNMVNGVVRVRNLTASSGSNKLTLTSSGLVMDGSVGNLSMGSAGIVYKDSRGVIKYEMNENFVRSSTFGTTTANIYLAASNGYEVRFANIADIPGSGEVNDYTYIDTRAKVMYAQGVANNPRHSSNLDLGADNLVRVMNNGRTTYGTMRAAGLEAEFLDLRPSSGQINLYIRPESGGEVRITDGGTTTSYASLRARSLMANSLFSNTSNNLYLRADNEIQFTSHGSTSTYRDVRGMFAKFDALDVNTGSHIYTRVHGASAELRVTARGTTDQYRDIRFRNWTAVSSEKYKTDITEWDYNVLDIIKDELKIYQYKYKDDVAEGDNIMYQRGLVLERETPSEFIKGDGINQYEMATWTLKGVQELAQRDNDKDKIIKEQSAKIEELEKQMSEVMQVLKKK